MSLDLTDYSLCDVNYGNNAGALTNHLSINLPTFVVSDDYNRLVKTLDLG